MNAASWDIPFGGIGEELLRLGYWQSRRVREIAEAYERERAAVDAALAKKPSERSAQEMAAIAYGRVPGGTAAGCGCSPAR